MAILYILFHLDFIMATKKTTKKKETKQKVEEINLVNIPVNTAKKETNYVRTRIMADTVGMLSQFIPRVDTEMTVVPLFSREFLLKNLLGLSDEEFELNEKLIQKESADILSSLKELLKQDETPAPTKKSKKAKVN